jgi:phasin family protein
MFTTPDQFLAMHKANLASLQALTASSISSFERLTQLNIAAARSTFDEVTEQAKSLLDAKDAKAFADLGVNAVQPAGEKLAAYAKHVYDIASETGAEMAKVVDQHFADGNRQLHSVIDSISKNAPAGSEGIVSFVKTAMTQAGSAYDQFNKASKQVADMAEANLTAASKSVMNGVNRARG